jgi:hypothetical protein
LVAAGKSVPQNMAKILFLKCHSDGKDLLTTKTPESWLLRFAHRESIFNLLGEIGTG